jgi:hypothetical protein
MARPYTPEEDKARAQALLNTVWTFLMGQNEGADKSSGVLELLPGAKPAVAAGAAGMATLSGALKRAGLAAAHQGDPSALGQILRYLKGAGQASGDPSAPMRGQIGRLLRKMNLNPSNAAYDDSISAADEAITKVLNKAATSPKPMPVLEKDVEPTTYLTRAAQYAMQEQMAKSAAGMKVPKNAALDLRTYRQIKDEMTRDLGREPYPSELHNRLREVEPQRFRSMQSVQRTKELDELDPSKLARMGDVIAESDGEEVSLADTIKQGTDTFRDLVKGNPDIKDKMAGIIEKMPANRRIPLELRLFEEMDDKDIARYYEQNRDWLTQQGVNIPKGSTIHQNYMAGWNQLRTELQRLGIEVPEMATRKGTTIGKSRYKKVQKPGPETNKPDSRGWGEGTPMNDPDHPPISGGSDAPIPGLSGLKPKDDPGYGVADFIGADSLGNLNFNEPESGSTFLIRPSKGEQPTMDLLMQKVNEVRQRFGLTPLKPISGEQEFYP